VKEHIVFVKLMRIFAILAVLSGCGAIDRQFTKVVSPDEVVVTEVYCWTLIGIPVFCVIGQDRTITVRVETIVTEIVETIVEVEVINEVIIERIVTEIETEYLSTEVDIRDIVAEVVQSVKELVPEENIKEVPFDKIVEEATNALIDEALTFVNDVTP
jgi:hypothetical protein